MTYNSLFGEKVGNKLLKRGFRRKVLGFYDDSLTNCLKKKSVTHYYCGINFINVASRGKSKHLEYSDIERYRINIGSLLKFLL